jgi:PAS domain S-box-containing protein/putative nucleotidyltransferase with HDIG domain
MILTNSLKKIENNFRMLVEHIPQKLFIKDRKLVYVYCNQNFASDLGITPEAIVGKTDFDFFPSELAEKYRSDDKRIIENGKTEEIEESYLRGDERLWVRTTKTAIRDKDGSPIGVLGIFTDITEKKRMEDDLREREERYHSLLDAISRSNIGLFLVDASYRVRFMNQALVATFGDQTGRICYEGVGKSTSPCEYCKLDEVVRQRKTIKYHPTTNIGKSYDIVAVPYKDQDGEICKLEIIQDITERKTAETALIESERRLRRFYESGMLGVIYWNMDGKIMDANNKFLEMVGYSRDELESGKIDWINMTPPEYRYLDDNSVEELKAFGVNQKPFEKEYLRKDGTRLPIILAGAMLDEKRFNGVAFVLDITERKGVEKELYETLEKLRRAIDTTIKVMVAAVEARDPYTAGHQKRTTNLARAIANEMVLSQEKIEGIRMAGTIHDIGKLSIPAEILSKPSSLTNIEFALIKTHSKNGYEILKDVESPRPLADIVHQHHERLDGSGYPQGLKGEEILIEARILAVADVVEAMASHRPYRPALGIEAALKEIEKNKGTLYDPQVVEVCLRLFREKGFGFE